LLDEHTPDVVCGCQSKLGPAINTQEVFPTDQYKVFRKDPKGKGEGVSVATNISLVATPEVELNSDCDLIWARIQIWREQPLYIGSFYRQPTHDDQNPLQALDSSLFKLTNRQSLPNIILAGNFNLPDIH